jgi:hypothetical protein
MLGKKLLAAALVAVAAGAAQAETTFHYLATAEEHSTGLSNYLDPGLMTSGPFTTGGLQTATAGAVSASLNAWADPVNGLFKSYTSINMSGVQATNIATASVRLDVTDTLRFSGPGSTVDVTFTMNYDTTFSGLGMAPFQRVGQLSHFMQTWSDRSVNLTYQVANPIYDPAATCSGGEMGCPPEAQPFNTVSEYAGKTLFREVALGGPNGIYTNGDADNGHYSGVVTLTATVPTETDITLTYFGFNYSACFHLASCALESDALHSDYLALKVDGGTYASASGYQYLGMAAAVPEPESYAMLSAGLGLIALVARRRSRYPR